VRSFDLDENNDGTRYISYTFRKGEVTFEAYHAPID